MISIIIPVLNEGRSIEKLLSQIKDLDGDKEIIVVDGGSTDDTVSLASKYARVKLSQKGRARQMNTGAEAAKGDILWFLHSDSIIDKDSLLEIEKVIEEDYIGGGFSLYFHDYNTPFMRFVSKTSNWRAKYLGLYFGDQAMFVKKDIFLELGGYKDMEIMEDWEFAKRLGTVGKMKMLKLPIGTSARRFKRGGQVKTLLLMHRIKLLYVMGVSPARISKIYREVR